MTGLIKGKTSVFKHAHAISCLLIVGNKYSGGFECKMTCCSNVFCLQSQVIYIHIVSMICVDVTPTFARHSYLLSLSIAFVHIHTLYEQQTHIHAGMAASAFEASVQEEELNRVAAEEENRINRMNPEYDGEIVTPVPSLAGMSTVLNAVTLLLPSVSRLPPLSLSLFFNQPGC